MVSFPDFASVCPSFEAWASARAKGVVAQVSSAPNRLEAEFDAKLRQVDLDICLYASDSRVDSQQGSESPCCEIHLSCTQVRVDLALDSPLPPFLWATAAAEGRFRGCNLCLEPGR